MKRSLVVSFLALFALWPAIQRGLAWHYDIDPWKGFGFAMYSVPGPMKTVRVMPLLGSRRAPALDIDAYSEAEQRAVDRFRERRRALGRLASMEPLGRRMLELHADWQGVAIVVVTLSLDAETARLALGIREQEIWRDGRVGPERTPVAPGR